MQDTKRVFYRCKACGGEWVTRMGVMLAPADEPCNCGEIGTWSRIDNAPDPVYAHEVPDGFVKGRPYEFKAEHKVMPQGRHYGVSDAAHEGHMRDQINRETNRQREIDRSFDKGKTDAPRLIGMMSMEEAHSIGLQEGDPTKLQKDPEHFLKATGRHIGR